MEMSKKTWGFDILMELGVEWGVEMDWWWCFASKSRSEGQLKEALGGVMDAFF
jgi:hypothetical protein|tara:strand:+ start:23568 stop:23726 length:159 start_codon:yes stop_codon:yes gene_type:complete